MAPESEIDPPGLAWEQPSGKVAEAKNAVDNSARDAVRRSGGSASPRDWVAAHREPLLREYLELLAIPNVASNRDDIRRNADHIVAMMERRACRRGCSRARTARRRR